MAENWEAMLGVVERGELDRFERWCIREGRADGKGMTPDSAVQYRGYVARVAAGGYMSATPRHQASMRSGVRKFLEWRAKQGRPLHPAPEPNEPTETAAAPQPDEPAQPRTARSLARDFVRDHPEPYGGELLLYEVRAAIAQYAIARRELADLIGNHGIIGTIGERYVAAALDGTLAPNSEKGYDVLLPDGTKVQVKTCAATQGQFGAFSNTSLAEGLFDVACFVLLDEDLLPAGGVTLPIEEVRTLANNQGVCFWRGVSHHAGATTILKDLETAAFDLDDLQPADTPGTEFDMLPGDEWKPWLRDDDDDAEDDI